MLTWRIQPLGWSGRHVAFVQTHDFDTGEQLPLAFLTDLKIEGWAENRGAGSMLVRRVIEECKRTAGIRGWRATSAT